MEIKLTPKEKRSRENWRKHLVAFQYDKGMSQEEMATYFKQQSQENTEKISEETKVDTGQNHGIIYNSADYVLSYLTPPRRQKK